MEYIVLIIGAFFLVCGSIPLAIYFVFRYCPAQTAKASAILRKTKYQKNVPMRDSTIHRTRIEKHFTRCTYIYVVGKKAYKCRDSLLGTPKQASFSLPIVYLKRFPRFFYINDKNDLGKGKFILYSVFPLVLAAIFIILGLAVIL